MIYNRLKAFDNMLCVLTMCMYYKVGLLWKVIPGSLRDFLPLGIFKWCGLGFDVLP